MKRKVAVLAILSTILSASATAQAAPSVTVNGEKVQTDAVIENDRTYVPVRAVFEQMGCQVDWAEDTKTAEIAYKNKKIKFSAYDKEVLVIDERMYVPLRMAGEALGVELAWEENTKTVVIDTNEITQKEKTTPLSVVEDNSSFAARFNALIPKDKNYMFSPLSLKYALAMAANGGDDETVEEITGVLDIADLKSYNDEAAKYLESLKMQKSGDSFYGYSFNVANSVWLNEDYTKGGDFSEEFKDIIEKSYNGEIENVNNENAVSKINSWCDEKTNHKIPSIINDSDFQACLINAVYFNGKWAYTFDKNETKKDIFTDRNGKETEIEFMNQEKVFHSYYEDENIKIISLPYNAGNINMYIALTDEENVDFEKYIDKMDSLPVKVSIPKFNIEYSIKAVDILSQLGIEKAFDPKGGHFNNMFDKNTKDASNMFIDDIIQKTFINVDEEGTEAAAITSVTLCGSLDEPEECYEFKANKPFTYFIRDTKTGDILFMGEYAFAEAE